jgi:hypothetical protein
MGVAEAAVKIRLVRLLFYYLAILVGLVEEVNLEVAVVLRLVLEAELEAFVEDAIRQSIVVTPQLLAHQTT